jgi:hypothetical protein
VNSVNKSPLETGRAVELTTNQQMDMIVWASSPTFPTACQILENEVLNARDEAMAVDPAEKETQHARMTEAHGMAKMYQRFRKQIEMASTNELAKLKERANRELLKDQELIENIVVSSASGN